MSWISDFPDICLFHKCNAVRKVTRHMRTRLPRGIKAVLLDSVLILAPDADHNNVAVVRCCRTPSENILQFTQNSLDTDLE